LTSLLHHHHHGEDANVWPLLVDRCADSAALTGSMHDQHEQLNAHLDAANAASGSGGPMPLPTRATASSMPSNRRSHLCSSTSMTRSGTSCR
jgi:hypothetical protein